MNIMSSEISFEVKDQKFWVLEKKDEKNSPNQVNAWVFNKEKNAVLKLREMMAHENLDFDDPDAMEKVGKKYILQEIEIGEKAFQIKPVSWFKVALLGFTKK